MAKNKSKELKPTTSQNGKKISAERHSTDRDCPVWYFTKIDKAGEYAFDINRKDFMHREVIDKMIHYSNMSWSDIKKQTHDDRRSKHHFISFDDLSKEAQNRFVAKQLTDYSDSIFSFALQNRLRIVGIRENEKFYVLWYDPEHKVCPSIKKHT